MDDPKVSVIVGAYNEEDSIARCIQSILGQTYNNIEIIIVDDGSSDDTVEIVRSFDSRRITLLENQSNIGLARSLNKGINAADGKYIARADADEYSFPSRIEKQAKILHKEKKTKAVGCWYRVKTASGSPVVNRKVPQRGYSVEEMYCNGAKIAHGSVMIRKEAVDSVGKYREEFELAQDYDLWLRMASRFGEDWLYVIPETLYERQIEGAMLAKRKKQRLYAEAAKAWISGNKRNYTTLIEKASKAEKKSYNQQQLRALTNYLAGIHLLNAGSRMAAGRCFIKSLMNSPVMKRPWYGIARSLLPEKYGKIIKKIGKKYAT